MNGDNILDILSDKSVLYAEDEAGIRDSVVKILKIFFKEVVAVSDSKEALEKLSESRYDVLIFDVLLPGMDGLEVIKRVRKEQKRVPIIILSAHTEQEYLWRAIELKITKYLKKPFNKRSFTEALELCAMELVDYNLEVKLGENCIYNPATKSVRDDMKCTKLSKSESKFLEYLIKHSNKIVTFEALYSYIWEYEVPSKEALKFLVKELRKKIGKDLIKNVYGVGYLLEIKDV